VWNSARRVVLANSIHVAALRHESRERKWDKSGKIKRGGGLNETAACFEHAATNTLSLPPSLPLVVQVLMKSIPMPDNDQLTISTAAPEKCPSVPALLL